MKGAVPLGAGLYQYKCKSGPRRYYLRRVERVFENGKKVRKERWVSLGADAVHARTMVKKEREKRDALERGEAPRIDLTLGQAVDWFVSDIRDRRKLLGWKDVRRNLGAFLAAVGDVPLRQIGRGDVMNYLQAKKGTLRPATINTILRDVKRLFNAAIDAGYLEVNPAHRIRPERVKLPVRRLPKSLEVERLMSASPVWLRRIILMLASTGCRLSECLTLDWSDVDLTNGTVNLRRRKVDDELELPMTDRLKSELWIMNMERGGATAGRVFLNAQGRPCPKERVWKVMKDIATGLGWPWLMPKTFRNLVATETYRATGDMRVAQKTLGHSTMRVTETVYVQGDAEARSKGIAAMNRFLGQKEPEPVGNGVGNETPAGSGSPRG